MENKYRARGNANKRYLCSIHCSLNFCFMVQADLPYLVCVCVIYFIVCVCACVCTHTSHTHKVKTPGSLDKETTEWHNASGVALLQKQMCTVK